MLNFTLQPENYKTTTITRKNNNKSNKMQTATAPFRGIKEFAFILRCEYSQSSTDLTSEAENEAEVVESVSVPVPIQLQDL